MTAAQADVIREIREAKRTALEDALALQLRAAGIAFERQFRFDPSRRWRSDFAITGTMLLVECDGGTHSGGRHVRGEGFERDLEKQNAAVLLGFKPLRFTARMVRSGKALGVIEKMLATELYYSR